MTVDDSQLVQLIREGDDLAVRLVLQLHGGRIQGYLRKRFPSFDDQHVHDVLVDAVLRLVATFDPDRGAVGPWLLLLAHRAAVDLLRGGAAQWSTVTLDHQFDVAEGGPSPESQLIDDEQQQLVRQSLQELSRLERAVIEADLDAGTTADAGQLARQHDTSEGSIYAARRRARTKLWKRLKQSLIEE
jgi:RNA polymerase sigma factor (sigma-70 family)